MLIYITINQNQTRFNSNLFENFMLIYDRHAYGHLCLKVFLLGCISAWKYFYLGVFLLESISTWVYFCLKVVRNLSNHAAIEKQITCAVSERSLTSGANRCQILAIAARHTMLENVPASEFLGPSARTAHQPAACPECGHSVHRPEAVVGLQTGLLESGRACVHYAWLAVHRLRCFQVKINLVKCQYSSSRWEIIFRGLNYF